MLDDVDLPGLSAGNELWASESLAEPFSCFAPYAKSMPKKESPLVFVHIMLVVRKIGCIPHSAVFAGPSILSRLTVFFALILAFRELFLCRHSQNSFSAGGIWFGKSY
ncbi:MAG: hypothetical protein D6820_14870 [Lentisphaerae bacterium]|nr:MAG: hypothetical protein D6820_14870 [Lentisphaerota bacterium]